MTYRREGTSFRGGRSPLIEESVRTGKRGAVHQRSTDADGPPSLIHSRPETQETHVIRQSAYPTADLKGKTMALDDIFDVAETTAKQLVVHADDLQARVLALEAGAVFVPETDDPQNTEAFAMSRLQWIVSEYLAPAIKELSGLRAASPGHVPNE